MLSVHEKYMSRCIQLAKKGFGSTSPNPMVGAVIVHNDKIIGEGYHRKCGENHAEVNAINSVADKSLLINSTMYVSLEPCAHVGKTPSCARTIAELKIPRLVVGSLDPFEKVNGKGIEILKSANIDVSIGILENECIDLNKRFYTFHQNKRPYIILKWAQTKDGFIDIIRNPDTNIQVAWITNDYCKTLVHKWRTEEDAFMIGTNTVVLDNPQLTARKWEGKNPVRITIDEFCSLDATRKIFDKQAQTIVFNAQKDELQDTVSYIKIDFNRDVILQILSILHELEIQSIVIEGGTETLNSFIVSNLWDEARIFTGGKYFEKGVKAPYFDFPYFSKETFGDSELKTYFRVKNKHV